jgi:hypothetical protein
MSISSRIAFEFCDIRLLIGLIHLRVAYLLWCTDVH